jgi:hypothetical protein
MELAARIALLLRKYLTVNPSRELSLNVWLASRSSGRDGAMLYDLDCDAAVILE